jgi:hypothetical protein
VAATHLALSPAWAQLVCDCHPNPVRTALDRLSLEQAQAALQTARSRLEAARKAGDSVSEGIFTRVVNGFEDELSDRAAVLVARAIVDESRKRDQQARDLITQMITS